MPHHNPFAVLHDPYGKDRRRNFADFRKAPENRPGDNVGAASYHNSGRGFADNLLFNSEGDFGVVTYNENFAAEHLTLGIFYFII